MKTPQPALTPMEAALLTNFERRLSALETSVLNSISTSSEDSGSAVEALTGLEARLSTLETSLCKLVGSLTELEPRWAESEKTFKALPAELALQKAHAAEMKANYRAMVSEFKKLHSEVLYLKKVLEG
jgi:uncharacterized coiled-coil protein SlyX